MGPTRTYTQLTAIVNLVAPGDLVLVDGDATYNGGIAIYSAGTVTNPIRIHGVRVNGKRPVISGGNDGIKLGGDHTIFEGFEVTGATNRCVFYAANDIVLRDLLVRNCPGHGILGADIAAGRVLIEYTEVTGCGSGTQRHALYLSSDQSVVTGATDDFNSVTRVQYCYIHDNNGGNGIKSRALRNQFYYNWVESPLYHVIEMIGPDPGGGGPDLYREDSEVVGNVLFSNKDSFIIRIGGDGTGATAGRYRFANNTIVTSGALGIVRIYDAMDSAEFYNNIFYRIGDLVPTILNTSNAASGYTLSGSNNWFPTGTTIPSAFTSSRQGASPGFVNAAGLDYRLTANSTQLVNMGTSSMPGAAGHEFPSWATGLPAYVPSQRKVLLPSGAAARATSGTLDIGAFELGSGAAP